MVFFLISNGKPQWDMNHHLSKDALGELNFEIGPVILTERMLFWLNNL